MGPPERAAPARVTHVRRASGYWQGEFSAMANPCEVLCQCEDETLARILTQRVAQEAWRIEEKYSRYRPDGVIHAINHANGGAVVLDAETTRLIDYGAQLWQLSDGRFDLTSGVLRRVWRFEAGATPPGREAVDALMAHVGWQRVQWAPPTLRLAAGMELDLGGIGKEYAVDRAVELLDAWHEIPVLVNFGGDLRTSGPPPTGGAWKVGIESTAQAGFASRLIELKTGALATSGDTRRRIEIDGVRYGHIIDARTGWPARDAPRSITVAAPTCTLAGTYSTLAMLEGAGAESFLDAEDVKYWCLR